MAPTDHDTDVTDESSPRLEPAPAPSQRGHRRRSRMDRARHHRFARQPRRGSDGRARLLPRPVLRNGEQLLGEPDESVRRLRYDRLDVWDSAAPARGCAGLHHADEPDAMQHRKHICSHRDHVLDQRVRVHDRRRRGSSHIDYRCTVQRHRDDRARRGFRDVRRFGHVSRFRRVGSVRDLAQLHLTCAIC